MPSHDALRLEERLMRVPPLEFATWVVRELPMAPVEVIRPIPPLEVVSLQRMEVMIDTCLQASVVLEERNPVENYQ